MNKNYIFLSFFLLLSFVSQAQKSAHSKGKIEVQAPPAAPAEPVLLISTSYGDIKIKLYNETPLHRDNFIKLADSAKFDGSTFHRVIQNFMIQGGGKNHGTEDMGAQIQGEIYPGLYHKRGVLSAARTGDNINPSRKSSGSQFYIVQGRVFSEAELKGFEAQKGIKFTAQQMKDYTTTGGTPHLDGAYTIFGEVVEGMDVVDKIAACPKQGEAPSPEIPMTIKLLSK